MSNTAADALSASTSSFVTSLVINSAIAGGELVAFVVCRGWNKAIYEPRTYIPPRDQQAPSLGTHILWPIWRIIWADPEEILKKNGVDAYVYVRFLIMMARAMVPIWFVSWIILLPVDAARTGKTGKVGLDRYTLGNVPLNMQDRLWTHLILDVVFIGWILFLVEREMRHWLVVRQKHLINTAHSMLPQANTVLIEGIPRGYMDEDKLAQLYSHLPGGVKRIWLNRDLKEMPALWERRNFAAKKLEAAEVKLIKLARKHRDQTNQEVAKLQKKGKPIPDALMGPVNPQLLDSKDGEAARDPSMLSLADQLVPRKKRPSMRLKPSWAPFGLGFLGIGKKVDTIEWCRKDLAQVDPALQKAREQLRNDVETPGEDVYPPKSSAFIQFNQQIAAHMAQQCVTHNMPYRMHRRFIEQSPANVLWGSLGLNPYEQNVRQAISYAITVGLIVAWTFPVAFIGVLSNVSTLTQTYPWLRWIQGKSFGKHLLQGVISGVLPPVLLALLMMLLPFVLRKLAAFEGRPSKTEVELDLMTRYFIFLVIHTFIVVTLSSGLIASVKPIAENPSSVATILAKQLPTASTFFITLILTQFTGLAGTLLQAVTLAIYYVKIILLGGSPRSVFNIRYQLQTTNWGTDFPGTTVYVVIMIGYCVISPIINGFAAAFFVVSAIVYKYLWIWVYDQPPETDTGGLFFPKAVNHVFVGIYIQEISLCSLFFLARDTQKRPSALAQGILMIIFIVITAGVHLILVMSYHPLRQSLPLSLAHLSYGMRAESGHEGSIIGQTSEDQWDHANANAALEPSTVAAKIDPLKKALPIPPIASDVKANLTEAFKRPAPLIKKKARSLGPSVPSPRSYTEIPTLPSPVHADIPENEPPAVGTSAGPPVEPTNLPTSAGPPVSPLYDEPEEMPPDVLGNGVNTDWVELGNMSQDPEAGNSEETETYFAVPGGPGVRSQSSSGDDPDAFFHPATKEPMRILWLPQDELGLCAAEIGDNSKAGFTATSSNAILTSKGKVRVFGPPPDSF